MLHVFVRGHPLKTSAVRGLSSADILQTRGFFRNKKIRIFFEIYGVFAWTRGEERICPVWNFPDKGERGSDFHDFMWTSFMDSP